MSAPRIVSLVPSLTELVCALGRGNWLVGRTGFCVHPSDALAPVPKVGGTKTVNIEKIRRLAPTHLIVNVDENEKPTVEALSEFIPNVVVTHPVAIDDNFELYRRFGRLFDAEARAGELCAELESALALTQSAPRATLRVLYLIWNDPWMTVSAETFIAKMLASVGIEVCVPPGDARYPSLLLDAVGSLGADAVLLSSEPCRFRPADRRELRAALVAGAAARAPVLGIDGEMTSWYGPRAIEGLRYLHAYRRRLEMRLEMRHEERHEGRLAGRRSGRTLLRQTPLAGGPGEPRLARAGCMLAAAVMLGFLAACSSAPPAAPSMPGGPAPAPEAGTPPPAAGAASSGRGRFYLDDGPGDRPLAELQKVPDAVPRAEPLHSRANRPYVIFGRQYEPMTRMAPFRERGIATWYGRRYHGRPTSIGEIYDMYGMTAAHPTLPLPSYARVTNVRTGRSVVVRVNDRGPFLHGRVIDLSYAAAAKLAAALPGSAEVEVELITQFDAAPAVTASSPPRAAPSPVGAPVAQAVQVTPVSSASLPPLRAEEAPRAPAVTLTAATVPAGPAMAAAPDTSAAAPSSASDVLLPGRYVQLGAYQSREGADAALARLRASGLPEVVSVRRDGALHKLVAGPYPQATDAQAAQRRLRAATGIEAFVLLR
jgi:rare lipoprotein A